MSSYPLLPHLTLSHLMLPYLLLPCLISSYLDLSYRILSHLIFSYLILSNLILPYLTLSYLTWSYLILSYLTLSYLILSHLTLSYLAFSHLIFFYLILSAVPKGIAQPRKKGNHRKNSIWGTIHVLFRLHLMTFSHLSVSTQMYHVTSFQNVKCPHTLFGTPLWNHFHGISFLFYYVFLSAESFPLLFVLPQPLPLFLRPYLHFHLLPFLFSRFSSSTTSSSPSSSSSSSSSFLLHFCLNYFL